MALAKRTVVLVVVGVAVLLCAVVIPVAVTRDNRDNTVSASTGETTEPAVPAPPTEPDDAPTDAPVMDDILEKDTVADEEEPKSQPPSDAPSIVPLPYEPDAEETVWEETTIELSDQPSLAPSDYPSMTPSNYPSMSNEPDAEETVWEETSIELSDMPSLAPSDYPSMTPSNYPSMSNEPDAEETVWEKTSIELSDMPSLAPSDFPSVAPSDAPSMVPSGTPTVYTGLGSDYPSLTPTTWATEAPTINIVPTTVAIAGPDYVVLAVETKTDALIMGTISRLVDVSSATQVATAGCRFNVDGLANVMNMRTTIFESVHEAEMPTPNAVKTVSSHLYNNRFNQCFDYTILGGLDLTGAGAVYNFNEIGQFLRVDSSIKGTNAESIGYAIEAIDTDLLTADEVKEIIEDAFMEEASKGTLGGELVQFAVITPAGLDVTSVSLEPIV